LIADDQEKAEAGKQRSGTEGKAGSQKDGLQVLPEPGIGAIGILAEMKLIDFSFIGRAAEFNCFFRLAVGGVTTGVGHS
jgi:hypothetical protein